MDDIAVIYAPDGSRARIVIDEYPESPREWDNLTTIYYTSDRYTLGDKHVNADELNELVRDPHNLYMPVQCYIHSGVTMKAAWRNDYPDALWDSGCSGIVVLERKKLLREFGKKRVTKQLRARAYDIMRGEVETFSQYLEGDVYGIIIEDADGEETDSCFGFYGYEYAQEEAKRMLGMEV